MQIMKQGTDYIGIGCGALIINNKNETLLMKRGPMSKNEIGFWSKPGGSVEFGEKVENAIKREIKEELDIEIELIKFLDYTDHIIKSENQHWIAFNYLAKIIKGEPKIMEPDKHDEIKWFSLDDLPDNITQTTKEPIEKYLKSLRNID
jgi:8-oxo-dGTP diphosphatase